MISRSIAFRSGWLAAASTVIGLAAPAATLRVWQDSPSPTTPYATWETAAHTIQDAVDRAALGDIVLVTNGVYATGGRMISLGLTNRVAVDKAVMLQSVNGPEFTVIRGQQVPGTTNGDGAVRCVYLASGASLSGFTLTGGATRTNGDDVRVRRGGGLWCESASSIASNCVLVGNAAARGGGGATRGTLRDCTLSTNSAGKGGGSFASELERCTLRGNSAAAGGGAAGGHLSNCVLMGNRAQQSGGGATEAPPAENEFDVPPIPVTLTSCLLTGNSATVGGGVARGTLNNCTVVGNSASVAGGVAFGGANNCIVYFNTAPSAENHSGSAMSYCCTTPAPASGMGNISLNPQLASAAYLGAGSPCRAAGSAAYASGTDIDGEPWANPPSIGCDEYYPGAATGPLSVGLTLSFTNVAAGSPVLLTALIEGRTTASVWSFGDGSVLSNQPWASHAWTAPGDYPVVLRAYNESHLEGVSAMGTVHVAVAQLVHYVAATSTNPRPPYLSWATAATNIQDAIDQAYGGSQVVVSNGVYDSGGRAMRGELTNRVAVDKAMLVRSVNGPQFTVIRGRHAINGDAAIRCVYLADGASLSGFTLTNGATRVAGNPTEEQSGGGLWCEPGNVVISNCVLVGNYAAATGGGAFEGTLLNCWLIANSAGETGGGARFSRLNDCALDGNSAAVAGGGASVATLINCVLTGNSARVGGGAESGTLKHCTLSGNSAGGDGGGTASANLEYCALTRNTARYYGGGAAYGTLSNCVLSSNSALAGGGAVAAVLNNCTVVGNSGGGTWGVPWKLCFLNNCVVYDNQGGNYDENSVLNFCCTIPQPANGTGNITNAPRFVDFARGNLRLQSNSPCINGGNNSYVSGGTDLGGQPRIVGGTVDIGAYEFQTPSSIISYDWLQQYGLPTDGSADTNDFDADLLNTWQEWMADTNPTDALSVLRIESISPGPPLTVQFHTSSNRLYTLRYATSLFNTSWTDALGQTDVGGTGGLQVLCDTNAVPPRFYRVSVRMPGVR